MTLIGHELYEKPIWMYWLASLLRVEYPGASTLLYIYHLAMHHLQLLGAM